MTPTMTEERIRQNLTDAGCDEGLIQSYLTATREDNREKCVQILERWRRVLLDDIHAKEEKLTCLDYLRYQLKK